MYKKLMAPGFIQKKNQNIKFPTGRRGGGIQYKEELIYSNFVSFRLGIHHQ